MIINKLVFLELQREGLRHLFELFFAYFSKKSECRKPDLKGHALRKGGQAQNIFFNFSFFSKNPKYSKSKIPS